MLAVLVLKGFNLLAEAEDKSYIERTGTAHGWDVLFYIFSFLKGIDLALHAHCAHWHWLVLPQALPGGP